MSSPWPKRSRSDPRHRSEPSSTAACQNCLQKGHWTYMCKNPPAYAKRVSRTKILKRPDLYKRAPKEEKPPEVLELEEELAAVERQERMMNDLLQSCDAAAAAPSAADKPSNCSSSSDSSSSSSSDSSSSSSDSDTDSDTSSSDSSSDSSSSTDSGSSSDDSSADSRRHRERVRLGTSSGHSKGSRRSPSNDQEQDRISRHRRSRSQSPYSRRDSTLTRRKSDHSHQSANDFIHPDRRRYQRK